MSIGMTTAVRNAMLDAITSQAGSGATLKLYTGTRPATGAAVTTQTLLGTLACSDPIGSAASGGTLTFSTITEDSSADATGTCTWARLQKGDGTALMDFSVTVTGGGGDITMNAVDVSAGQALVALSATITAGNA